MTKIKFTASPKGRFAKTGEKGYNTTLEEIKEVSKSIATRHNLQGVTDWDAFKTTEAFEKYKAALPSVQMFDCDYRVANANLDWNLWNGCVYVDIDSKKYNGDKEFDVNEVGNLLISRLECAWSEYFYAFQVSASRNSYHIIFYFNVEKNEINFNKCAKYAFEMVGDAFHRIGRDDIWGCKGVADAASQSAVQLMQMSPYPIFYNSLIPNNFGEWKDIDDYYNEISPLAQAPDITPYEIVDLNLGDKMWDIDHNERFYLYTVFKRITPNEAICNAYWAEFCKHIVCKKPKHSPEYFTTQFQSQYESLAADKAKLSLLRKYGIVIDKSKIRHYLSEGQYLSDIYDDIMNETTIGCNILQAGTGVGKTTIWKRAHMEIMSKIMSNPEKRKTTKPILIVEPLNSIINSKYLDEATKKPMEGVHLIREDVPMPKVIEEYGMYVTSYNKILKRNDDGYELMDDPDGFFGQFEYVVVDESHILSKDDFRANVIIPIIDTLNRASSTTKIILQTATPMDEENFFEIKNWIVVSKTLDKKIDFIFRNFVGSKPFEIEEVSCLAKHYLDKGRKVYIYANSYPLEKLNKFKEAWYNPERVAIVHKRNGGETSQNDILENNKMLGDKYDVLITSIYFGVGCDLNDEGKAAVIIVGNNTWQEDMQVVGRFRKANDIKVCQVNLVGDYNYIAKTSETTSSRSELFVERRTQCQAIWNDKVLRPNSALVRDMGWSLQRETDVDKLAYILSAPDYYSQYNVKMNMMLNPYYGWQMEEKGDFKHELTCTKEYMDRMEWKAKVDAINNGIVKRIVKGEYKGLDSDKSRVFWQEVQRSTKVSKWKNLWFDICKWGVDKDVDIEWVCNLQNMNALKVWCELYRQLKEYATDYTEITSLLAYRYMIEDGAKEEVRRLRGKDIPYDKYCLIMTHLRWLTFKDKDVDDYRMAHNYFNQYKTKASALLKVPAKMIEMFYTFDKVQTVCKELVGFIDEVDMEQNEHSFNDYLNKTESMNLPIEVQVRMLDRMLAEIDGVNKYDVIRKVNSKAVTIAPEMPERLIQKHGFAVGDTFKSKVELSRAVSVNIDTIRYWFRMGWVV